MTAPRDQRTAAVTIRLSDDLSKCKRYGHWGPWHLDRAVRVLWTEAGGYRYEVDLDTCVSSAEMLDWIMHIAGKIWGSTEAEHHEIIAGLVNALNQVLHPQANLCSSGYGKRLSAAQIRYLVSSYGKASNRIERSPS